MTKATKLLLAASYAGLLFVGAVASSPYWVPACEYEDSSWCFWDAQNRGNGHGNSFVALWAEGPVLYVPQP